MSVDKQVQTYDTARDILVQPKEEFKTLLQDAGATKDVFTMKEVMFYLGQYIFQKELYDRKQQNIIHCSQDPLGRVFGVDSFSATDPFFLSAIINKNLVAVRSHESPPDLRGSQSNRQTDRDAEEADSESCSSSPDRRRKRKSRWGIGSSEPGPDDDATEDESDESEEEADKKKRRSDSFSPTFNKETAGVTQCCLIGGEGRGRDRHSSQSSDSGNTSTGSQDLAAASAAALASASASASALASASASAAALASASASALASNSDLDLDFDSDSCNFEIEFEVESNDSDNYINVDPSSSDDQECEDTVLDEEEDDSLDEDTEGLMREAFNPPVPRQCIYCWTLQDHWLSEDKATAFCLCPTAPTIKPTNQSEAKETPGSDAQDNEGVNVPDGQQAKTPSTLSQSLSDSASSAPDSHDLPSSSTPSTSPSQQKAFFSSSLDFRDFFPSPPIVHPQLPLPPPATPDLGATVSPVWPLPELLLEPCLICQSQPNNGCIVHGRTGHLMCCYVCARKLKKRGKPCPVCRLPIQSVIRTYIC